MKRFEIIALGIFWSIFLIIYASIEWTLEMYTTQGSSKVFWGLGLLLFPAAIYALLVVSKRSQSPWYGNIVGVLIVYGIHLMAAYTSIKKADLLWSLITQPITTKTYTVAEVKKVVLSRGGFDHTNVTVAINGQPVVFETSRTGFFLLQHKKQITMRVGRSGWGNYYATYIYLPAAERSAARAAYWSYWWQRYKWLWAFVGAVVLFIVIRVAFFPASNVTPFQPKPKLSFGKAMLIIAVVLTGLFMLLALGVYVYAHVIHHCNC